MIEVAMHLPAHAELREFPYFCVVAIQDNLGGEIKIFLNGADVARPARALVEYFNDNFARHETAPTPQDDDPDFSDFD